MPKVRENKSNKRPALTPEARENQMIALAVNLAEKQLQEGTASSQVITHFLKLGSTKERLEKEKLEEENKLYSEALNAMRRYSGQGAKDDEDIL